ncbi:MULTISPECIES: sigma-54 interaction domain-containing protein [Paraclostridium]|uniref:Sigma 54-interacting transcriptional regulator n=1 Tax=Paraclostridium bifermentans TaxID=1490 RepID=A0AA44IIF0_PARBF|nr:MULTISPECIES: sigma 54-interacting transcriptional regulator [Paraclostridium]MBN8048291.1 sigma 54-interacting transcriptional regulator [Paraclostridium bifermentans]MBZ6007171.1 sigma 54-interacting transcriptional regulator [Paraclostridium bifermentans]MDU0298328.1 sigma 54-interacting transcriptional regulator [Paraclostridium sp. MRS3W1]NME10929.1 sigma 54-interacting transcriptional regulator [Paraclostridium bifermentans]
MKKRELAIVTLKKDAGEIYANQINYFLGDSIKINLYSFEEGGFTFFEEKLILLSVNLKYEEILKMCNSDAQIIIPNLTFEKSSFEKICKINKNETIFVYNLSKSMALETIAIIYRLGVDIPNLIPCYPEMKKIPENSIVLTPGEKLNIEAKNCKIIDLEYRIIDLSSIADIAMKLNLESLIQEDLVKKFMDKIVPISYITEKLLVTQTKLENQFDFLLSAIDDGIIGVSNEGIVQFYSHVAREILSINGNEMIGKYIGEYVKSLDFDQIIKKEVPYFQKLIKVNNIDINMEVKYTHISVFNGFIIKVSKFHQAEKKQAKLRAQLMSSGNVSKYNFDDIIGCSYSIKNTKKIAYKMAQSDSSILIIGESGTGKELFAQSIHSASRRSQGPFVAVNCSTFQEGLLQSELFGYDEGAFTGARKGGKIGLFELANKGTIFLDEIGEMDLNSQATLLRVIQEKQIRRVGSDKIIDVDIRIIAATNRDLKKLVCENKFRKDLFYRLNVLPLKIAPLRNRNEDVFLIFESFKKNLDVKFSLSDELVEVFKTYSWEGNIRELRNLVEYCSYLDKSIIEIYDLPEYMLESIKHKDYCLELSNKNDIKNISNLKRDLRDYIFVLEKINNAYVLKQRIGRRKIYEYALEEKIFLTEQQIRSILIELQEFGFVKILSGRGGSVITEKGILFLEENKRV